MTKLADLSKIVAVLYSQSLNLTMSNYAVVNWTSLQFTVQQKIMHYIMG